MKLQFKLNYFAILGAAITVAVIFAVSGCSKESATEPPNPEDTLTRLLQPTFALVVSDTTGARVLSVGAPGEWDQNGVWWPSVIQDGDTLRMWYTGFDNNDVARIGYAWSLDGQNWHKYAGNPVLSASLSWERDDVGECEVIKDGTTFKMWYGAGAIGDPTHKKIGYATSSDGINWTKHADAVMETGPAGSWEDQRISVSTVLKEDGAYKMWYNGGTGPWSTNNQSATGYATSSDGISWSKQGRAIRRGAAGQWDSQRAWGAVVVKVSSDLLANTYDRYEMVYSGADAPVTTQWLGYASSKDGETWAKSGDNPIVNTHPGFGSNYYSSELLKCNGEYHLWFTSWNSSFGQIGYAKGTR